MNFYQIKIDKPRWKGVIENLSKTTVNIRGISIPYKDFQSQKERLNGKAGIYFFIWIDGETGNIQKCYIGETENLALRPLQKHGSIKLDWHYVTVFFRDHDIERHFDTDTRQYIEQTLIDQFPYPKILINGNGGHKSKKKMLPEDKLEIAQKLVDTILDMAPALSFGLFVDFKDLPPTDDTVESTTSSGSDDSSAGKDDPPKRVTPPPPLPPRILFHILDEKKDIDASMYIGDNGKYYVTKGSRISNTNQLDNQKGQMGNYKKRLTMESDGRIVDRLVTADMEFNSPSGAATIVRGTATSGLDAWHTEDGKSLGEWMKA